MDNTTKILELANHYLQLKGVKDSLLRRLTEVNAEMKAVKEESEALQREDIERENDNRIESELYI